MTKEPITKTPINDPQHWRDRAAEMCALADTMKDPETMDIILRLVDDYDTIWQTAPHNGKQTPTNNASPYSNLSKH
jgi:hypothetical protein